MAAALAEPDYATSGEPASATSQRLILDQYAATLDGHSTAGRKNLARALKLLDELLGDWDETPPAVIAAKAARAAGYLHDGTVRTAACEAVAALKPLADTVDAIPVPGRPAELVGISIIARDWLGKDPAAVQSALQSHIGWPQPDAYAWPGSRFDPAKPHRYWRPDSRPAWLAYWESLPGQDLPGEESRRQYASDWKQFTAWCGKTSRTALPAETETVTGYVRALIGRGLTPASIERALTSIRAMHKIGGHPVPDTRPARPVIRAYRDTRAASPDRQP